MAEQFVYGKPEPQGILEGIGSLFRPTRQRVLQAPSFRDVPVDMGFEGQVTRTTIPGKYGEPEFGLEYTPIVRGIASLLKDPKGTFKELAEAMSRIPERQLKSAIAMSQGLGGYIDPKTGEAVIYDPTLVPALTAAGTAASIARVANDGSAVLGIMGSRLAKDGPKKFDEAVSLKKQGASNQEIFDKTGAYFDTNVLGDDISSFRFEIPTANSKLTDEVSDGRLENTGSVKLDPDGLAFPIDNISYKRLDEVLDFPELYKQYPDLKDLKVARLDQFNGAFYNDGMRYIAVGDQLNDKNFQSALLHEVQHVIQRKEFNPDGANFPQIRNYIEEILEEELGQNINKNFLKQVALPAYRSVYGEVEARAVQRRFENPEEARIDPVKTRQKEAQDTNLSLTEIEAAEGAAYSILDELKEGNLLPGDVIK
jgi:hypothetical protein